MSSQASALLWPNNARFGAHSFDEILDSNKGNSGTGSTAKAEVVKTRQQKPRFTADYLASNKGLKLIYSEFPKVKFSKEKGKELQNLHLLLQKYKEWGSSLYPLKFSDLISKIESFSGSHIVQVQLFFFFRNERDGMETNIDDIVYKEEINVEMDKENDNKGRAEVETNIVDPEIEYEEALLHSKDPEITKPLATEVGSVEPTMEEQNLFDEMYED
ncbi:hypothetical protein RFI_14364 [Reticulomyxa filosa]|uniref:Chromosome segregation in meiosis protein 3 domain-containing protein n=1 Tax=Reticulomyxa filosa TaxID=46433 RepID=X6N964_RETFI|nr:hypothetical protein RFI_14364 [Reticulomyxa filosa]|eukprot:ETO22830.1 hypothetical protein RFI_14364 [Reticulomyxa filosa]